jgi:tetratricopeptide (TPR) repeat protein
MIERHYDDESLIALIGSDPGVAGGHLPGCRGCREKLESFRMIADALRDEDVWDMQPLEDGAVASTIANLRAFADQMTDEDARAESWLSLLLEGARESWRDNLARHPEYRTAGMVRKLIAATDRAIDTMPADAVEIAGLATDIADHLDPADHPSNSIFQLRGSAWREKAFALYYTGQYTAAREATRIANAQFEACLVSEYDQARVGIVVSTLERNMDDNDASLAAARESRRTFARFGDLNRYSSARSAEAAALADAGRHAEALSIWLDLENQFGRDDWSDAHARNLGNIAFVYRQVNRPDEAIHYYRQSAEIFEAMGTLSEGARIRWSIAAILAECGRLDEAAVRLTRARIDLQRLGMFGPAALAALDLAEVRLIQGRQADVVALCSEAIAQFNASGLRYSARALNAIAFMRESAMAGEATPDLARSVREYVRRLPNEPALLFLSADPPL